MQIDEHKALREAARGARAQALLDDELIKEAFQTLEDAYVTAWRATTLEQIDGREKLFLAINVVGKVREQLAKAVADGKLAAADLRAIAEAAERKKAWHEIR